MWSAGGIGSKDDLEGTMVFVGLRLHGVVVLIVGFLGSAGCEDQALKVRVEAQAERIADLELEAERSKRRESDLRAAVVTAESKQRQAEQRVERLAGLPGWALAQAEHEEAHNADPRAAFLAYRDVVNTHPDSYASKQAKARLKALKPAASRADEREAPPAKVWVHSVDSLAPRAGHRVELRSTDSRMSLTDCYRALGQHAATAKPDGQASLRVEVRGNWLPLCVDNFDGKGPVPGVAEQLR